MQATWNKQTRRTHAKIDTPQSKSSTSMYHSVESDLPRNREVGALFNEVVKRFQTEKRASGKYEQV